VAARDPRSIDVSGVRLASLLVAAAVAAQCAPAIRTGSHVDRSRDFARYRTYDWGPADALPTGDARLDGDPVFKDRVHGAVERQMASRGYQLVAEGASDLVIHYHANISRRIDVNRVDRTYGYCAAGDCPTAIVEYEEGTLVLDVLDARSGVLIWRGWAQNRVEDLLDDPEAMARVIERAVSEMMRSLPRPL
jgi:hypothetical protein